MSSSDIVAAIGPVAAELERLGVPFAIVGSVASSAHGIARSTIDVDLVVDLSAAKVDELVDSLARDYYVDRDAARDAVKRRGMFNVIHLETVLKLDLYVLTRRPFDRQSFASRRSAPLEEGAAAASFPVERAEDTILHKLEWYRVGGEVSERQWSDVVGVIKVQGDALDVAHLARWGRSLDVVDLLQRAFREAGVPFPPRAPAGDDDR